jgi:hypothetical protein
MTLRLSDLRAGKEGFWYLFLLDAESPRGHSEAGRIRSIEKSDDLIGTRTRDLPAYSIVPQPTTSMLPRTPRVQTVSVISGLKMLKKQGVRLWPGFKCCVLPNMATHLPVHNFLSIYHCQLLNKRICYKNLHSYKITQKHDDNCIVVTIWSYYILVSKPKPHPPRRTANPTFHGYKVKA